MDRRTWLLGAAGLLAGAAAPPEQPLFSAGPLAGNAVAQNFKAAPAELSLPDVPLVDPDGRPRRLGELRGRPAVVSLWAEWCAPCLAEASDLSALAARHRGRTSVLAVLTDSSAKLDGPAARARLDRAQARNLPTWAEPGGGDRLLAAVAGDHAASGGLPCNLLVDAAGRVRGRSFGASFVSSGLHFDMKDGKLTAKGKAQLAAASLVTVWATPDADTLLDALAAGALDRV